MKFDVYYYFKNKKDQICPGIKPCPTEWSDIVKLSKQDYIAQLVEAYRAGNEEAKKKLPSICYVGDCMKTRMAKYMMPTQAVMIDIDHCEDARKAISDIKEKDKEWWLHNVLIAHITPSGKGVRIVFWAQEGTTSLAENMDWFNKTYDLAQYGKFDAPCKDFSRISFIFKYDDLIYESTQLYTAMTYRPDGLLKNYSLDRKEQPLFDNEEQPATSEKEEEKVDYPVYTKEEEEQLTAYDYRGTPVMKIVDKYVEVYGKPGKSEVHNYYNDLVKNFRNITNNDKRVLFFLLPRFGHTPEECWSQIVSICRVNTLSNLPKSFYFFLKENGFYKQLPRNSSLSEYMLADEEKKEKEQLPWLPPVFKELLSTAPSDFKVPLMNALLPILGTLTSYLKSTYYYDFKTNTTSFFSIIFAPAGTGKGFAGRYIDMLMEKLVIRDYIQNAREQIYLTEIGKKGDNERSPEDPHTSIRIVMPKMSESEFLTKQKDNHGYHMFTYAAEMDSWAKGVKAAGGNKDDMLRIAWDNDKYGQHFKSANTFKGVINLYWNVLITGTLPQVMAYFKNVENGLVTRCSFTSIDNQEFVEPPKWKLLTPKQKEVVNKFMDRCDRRTYHEPCTLLPEDVDCVDAKKFDDEVPWRFTFRERQEINMEWLRPTIEEFLRKHLKLAAMEFNQARDVFRRRVAVRGFRLGMICYALWENPRHSDLMKCCPFIMWWMEKDIDNMIRLWGEAYNNQQTQAPNLTHRNLYAALPDKFSKSDVYVQCIKLNIQTPVRHIISKWKKFGYVQKVANNEYNKVKGNEDKRKEQIPGDNG